MLRIIQVSKVGSLPMKCVKPSGPFAYVARDYAKLFLVKDGKPRNHKVAKTYICIFVCFCIKTVHIKFISDLSSEAFLSYLKRFIAHRGLFNSLFT